MQELRKDGHNNLTLTLQATTACEGIWGHFHPRVVKILNVQENPLSEVCFTPTLLYCLKDVFAITCGAPFIVINQLQKVEGCSACAPSLRLLFHPLCLEFNKQNPSTQEGFLPVFSVFLMGKPKPFFIHTDDKTPLPPPFSKLSKTRHCKGNLLAWRRGLSWICVAAEPRAAQTADCRVCVLM